jgi:Uma2 family endonuclease
METTTTKKIWTDEELMQLPKDGYKYELVDGDIVRTSAGVRHGHISGHLACQLDVYIEAHKIGVVLDSSTGFRMKSGNVRSPDVSFVAKERLVGMTEAPEGFFEGAPDLAVEVLSPDDKMKNVLKKLAEYFDNGTRLAWVVNPKDEIVLEYRSPESATILTDSDILDGGEVVPGFTLPIATLFERWNF